ncbi:hypothetical protein COMA1_30058 [Candidatus Nitrospira nitrosa]|uniref:Uncharacterized protein n=1 Tax=Candidatus Nitrospira nitrosa TaxID=1742972 RepID=A0A0S4LFQ9_9BACT|nr:hypothetical protein COMA1_30058 [Candidatus Nitrospira nitrosa]
MQPQSNLPLNSQEIETACCGGILVLPSFAHMLDSKGTLQDGLHSLERKARITMFNLLMRHRAVCASFRHSV